MSQSDPIYACTGTNHARYFIGSRYIFAVAGRKAYRSNT